MSRSSWQEVRPQEVEVSGERYRGSYRVIGSPPRIQVTSALGQKVAKVGGLTAEHLAGMLLRELVQGKLAG